MRIEIEPGVRLFVDVIGSGWVPDGPRLRQRPTVILMHGGPGFDHSAFRPVLDPLAEVAQLIVYDHRGHGRSDRRPPSEWTLDTWADDIVRLCDALGVERPIVLGQSFGGFVAQRYLARHPQHPAKVVLSSTSGAFNLARKLACFEARGRPAARALAERFWNAPDAANTAEYMQQVMPLYNTQPAADPQARERVLPVWEILWHFVRHEMPGMDLLPGLAAARCPVLVMAGEDDPVCPLADAQDIAAALPPGLGELVSFPGVGHGAWRDRPAEALALLRRFITD